MAHVTDIRTGGTSIFARMGELRTDLVARFVDYRNYRNTLKQLRVLSPRELDDLGLAYADLREVSYKTVYGHKI